MTLNQTNTSGINGSYEFNTNISDGYWNWTLGACDGLGVCTNATGNFTIDATAPLLIPIYPTGLVPYHQNATNITLNFSITDDNLDDCWYDSAGVNATLNCAANSSMNITHWNMNNITYWANDTFGNYNSSANSWGYQIYETNRTFNATADVSNYESFLINVTANASLTAVTLFYDGVEYAMVDEGNGLWNYSMNIPTTAVGANSFLFEFTYAGVQINSSSSTQTISQIVFTPCNATYFTPYVNVTFRDESTLTDINATLPYSRWVYYLSSFATNRTLIDTNLSHNYNYTYCAQPNTSIFYVVPYVQYASTGYPQRVWNPSFQTYNATMTTQVLYLLGSADGIYVTFQVTNAANTPLSGVVVTATREISGSDVQVGAGTTGADGSVTFWLNPDFIHDFSFSLSGYTTYETSFAPTQSAYTIILGGGGIVSGYDYTQGISFSVNPPAGTLVNSTDYNFNFTISSTFWDLDSWGFYLKLRNGTIINSTSASTDSGGVVSVISNTRDYNRIIMDYYYVVNSTTMYYSTYWNVFNTNQTQWSIATFFTDLDMYLTSGLFGIDDFGRYFIIFMILFLSIGILGYKYGTTNPLVIASMVFAVVFFFDVVVDLLPEVSGAVPNVLTYISALILIILIFKEVQI
jgi:hypothetical protein